MNGKEIDAKLAEIEKRFTHALDENLKQTAKLCHMAVLCVRTQAVAAGYHEAVAAVDRCIEVYKAIYENESGEDTTAEPPNANVEED